MHHHLQRHHDHHHEQLIGWQPRGRRLWGKAEVRGAEAAQHAGQEVDAMVNEWWGWIMMKYLDDNDKVRGAEAAQYAGQDDEKVMLACSRQVVALRYVLLHFIVYLFAK